MDRAQILNITRDIALFTSANAIGFFSGPFAYHFGMVLGIISSQSVEANIVGLNGFFSGTAMVWLVCVFISLGFFIVQSHHKWRWAFLLCPIFVPLIYGFAVLNTLSVMP